MEKSDHSMLVGEGAQDFAKDCGISALENKDLQTESSRAAYEVWCEPKNNNIRQLFSFFRASKGVEKLETRKFNLNQQRVTMRNCLDFNVSGKAGYHSPRDLASFDTLHEN